MQHKVALTRGFTLVELLVVIAIIGILVALLLPAVQAARESARRSQCTNNLKQQGLAVQMHHDQRGMFPTGRNETRQKGQSWAFLLLPMMEERAIFDSLVKTERMDSPANAAAMRTPVEVYTCPSRRSPQANRDFDNNDEPTQVPAAGASGDYAANVGHRLLIGLQASSTDALGESMRIDAAQSGPIYTYSKIKARRVTDGLSNTLAIGERHIPPTDGQDMPNGEHYWQGDTAFLAADCPRTVFGVAIHGLRDEGTPVKAGEGDIPRESFGGPHSGITLFVYLGGHVDGVNNDASTETLAALSAIGDGNVVSVQ